MPTPHSFLRAAAGYIFMYMAITTVAAFVLIQVGEAVSVVTNPHHGLFAKCASGFNIGMIGGIFVFIVYLVRGLENEDDRFVAQQD
jgi:ABC-type Co2+ transport system permease subunit